VLAGALSDDSETGMILLSSELWSHPRPSKLL